MRGKKSFNFLLITVLLFFSLINNGTAQSKISAGYQSKAQTFGLGIEYEFTSVLHAEAIAAPFSYNPRNQAPASYYGMKLIYKPFNLKIDKISILPYLSTSGGVLHYLKSSKYPSGLEHNFITTDFCFGTELKLVKRFSFSCELGEGDIKYRHLFFCANYGVKYYFR